jgi:hypothetical protein
MKDTRRVPFLVERPAKRIQVFKCPKCGREKRIDADESLVGETLKLIDVLRILKTPPNISPEKILEQQRRYKEENREKILEQKRS